MALNDSKENALMLFWHLAIIEENCFQFTLSVFILSLFVPSQDKGGCSRHVTASVTPYHIV